MFSKVLVQGSLECQLTLGTTCERIGVEILDPESVQGETDDTIDAAALTAAAKNAGAQAVHPGDLFPHEQCMLADAARGHAMTYVGPPNDALEVLRSKLRVRELAENAGVLVVPGSREPVTARDADIIAAEIGYPVRFKPVAGAAGVGIRLAADEDEIRAALEESIAAAAEAFDDDRVYLERDVGQARQMDVTVIVPEPGKVLCLPERETSLRHRGSLWLTESPSPWLLLHGDGESLRDTLWETTRTVVEALGIVGVATCEFLLDPRGGFFLLDVNAGIPADRGVTEMLTGLDLVELDLLIAAGDPLPEISQETPRTGHSMGTRIMVSGSEARPGLEVVRWPLTQQGRLRLETAVQEGTTVDTIPSEDTPIAGITTYGAVRHLAAMGLDRALAGTALTAHASNLPLLRGALNHRSFQAGEYDAAFFRRLEQEATSTP